MRLTLAAIVFAVAGASAYAANYDLERMQAHLAEQEARINDLNAKLAPSSPSGGDTAEGLISLRKNAVITLGGEMVTKMQYTKAKISSRFERNAAGEFDRVADYRRRADSKGNSLEVSDAYVMMQVDVNDHFEAYLEMDLHNGTNDDYWNAEVYYVRWKNICESGFGLKIGRDALVFGEEGVGELGSYAAGSGDGIGELDEDFLGFTGIPSGAGGIPLHNGWDVSGVTQFTPYWEGLDGKLTAEVSLFQNVHEDEASWRSRTYYRDSTGVLKYRSYNYGAGTGSARIAWEPIEDLKLTASFANYRRGHSRLTGGDDETAETSANNTVYGFAASWRPSFADQLNLWGQWVHGNNVFFERGLKSDAFNFGASWDFTEQLTVFAQGDYVRSSHKRRNGGDPINDRGTAWAFYTGIQYSLPYGVSLEAGWKHEVARFKDKIAGERLAKIKGDTIYAMLGFEF